jgi:hypothetical protein
MTDSGMRAGDRQARCSRRNSPRRNGPQRFSLSDSRSGRLHHARCRARCSQKRCPARQQVTTRYFNSRRALPTSPMRSKQSCSLANRQVGASMGTLSADVRAPYRCLASNQRSALALSPLTAQLPLISDRLYAPLASVSGLPSHASAQPTPR